MKNLTIKFLSYHDKSDWSFSLTPYLNFGNQIWEKGFVINFGWGFWNIHFGYIKPKKTKK